MIKHKLMILGILLGSIAGYAYYFFVGCKTGTCAITSSPFNSTIYGAVMGALLSGEINKTNSKNE